MTTQVCAKSDDSCYDSVFDTASGDDTELLPFSVFKCRHLCSAGLMSGDSGGMFITVRTPLSSLVIR